MRKRPRATKLAGRSTAPFCCGVSANSLHLDLVAAAAAFRDQAAHVARRLDGRIILVPGVGGAKFARENACRGGCQTQRDNKFDSPRKVSAAVHWQRFLLSVESAGGTKRFNAF